MFHNGWNWTGNLSVKLIFDYLSCSILTLYAIQAQLIDLYTLFHFRKKFNSNTTILFKLSSISKYHFQISSTYWLIILKYQIIHYQSTHKMSIMIFLNILHLIKVYHISFQVILCLDFIFPFRIVTKVN